MPAHVLSEISTNQGREKCAHVDPHVKDGEAGVATLVIGRVELSNDGADIRFKESRSQDDQDKAGVEGNRRVIAML